MRGVLNHNKSKINRSPLITKLLDHVYNYDFELLKNIEEGKNTELDLNDSFDYLLLFTKLHKIFESERQEIK